MTKSVQGRPANRGDYSLSKNSTTTDIDQSYAKHPPHQPDTDQAPGYRPPAIGMPTPYDGRSELHPSRCLIEGVDMNLDTLRNRLLERFTYSLTDSEQTPPNRRQSSCRLHTPPIAGDPPIDLVLTRCE